MQIDTKEILNKWKLYTLTNSHGMKVSFLNFGGIITEITVPNKDGRLENVVLGYEDYEDYESNPNFFGAIVGRVAGRIQDASFTLNKKIFTLEANEGAHHLHGGATGFHHVIWKSETIQSTDTVGVILTHHSSDGEGGYPGNLSVSVTYTLNNDNEFSITYTATTDQTTALTLTNHSYFNLSGNLADTIENHEVTMNSRRFIELDQELIPTGEILEVSNTPFDFRNGKMLSDGINSTSEQNKIVQNGYDHYFIFEPDNSGDISVREESSGRVLRIKTDQPGVVMYTSNSLTEGLDLVGGKSKRYLGVCFETQASPASLHHEGFPTVLLVADETYEKQTVFSFGVKK